MLSRISGKSMILVSRCWWICPRQFALPVEHGHRAVIGDRQRQEPDGDAVIAAQNQRGFTNHRHFDDLADHAFQPRRDVAGQRRVEEARINSTIRTLRMSLGQPP